MAYQGGGFSSTLFPGQIVIWNVSFFVEKGNQIPWSKTIRARIETNNKLNPHMVPRLGVEPRPLGWGINYCTNLSPQHDKKTVTKEHDNRIVKRKKIARRGLKGLWSAERVKLDSKCKVRVHHFCNIVVNIDKHYNGHSTSFIHIEKQPGSKKGVHLKRIQLINKIITQRKKTWEIQQNTGIRQHCNSR